MGLTPGLGRSLKKEKWQPTLVLPGEFHGQRSLMAMCFPGCTSGKEPACQCRRGKRHEFQSPRGGRSPGGGNGNPLQYSCLENPTDRGAWATVHGVAKSRTWLKRLSMQWSMGPQRIRHDWATEHTQYILKIWWSSGQDSVLLMQGAWVQSLVRELEPTCRN